MSIVLLGWLGVAGAQQPAEVPPPPEEVEERRAEAAGDVGLRPVATDARIRARLEEVLRATEGLPELEVRVDQGVVTLTGEATEPEYVDLATELARNTEGVVAVIDRLEVREPAWDLAPARQELRSIGHDLVAALPAVGIDVVIVILGWFLGRLSARFARPVLRRRIGSGLIRDVAARGVGLLVFLLGLYLALRLAGLTRLAMTVVGGTGLIGLVVGIAFRGITENFLASLLLSMQHPFREGDLVEIAGNTGYVQRLTSRATVLFTLDGSEVQIPNATVFASVVRNFTSSPNRRADFAVGIGYDDSVPRAQELALGVLRSHPAVLSDPEPLVLVEGLGTSTVDLRVYFWLDGSKHSWLKVRSSVIRLVKRAFQDGGVSLPDEAREVVFPRGVPVVVQAAEATGERPRPAVEPEPDVASTSAEGNLQSEAADLGEQGRRAWRPETDDNLLAGSETAPRRGGS